MSTFETTLHKHDRCVITLFHDPDDPMSWIIRKWKKRLFGSKCLLSRWFVTRDQAEQFAASLAAECDTR